MRLGGQSLPVVVAGLVNVASIMGVVGLAHRRGGPPAPGRLLTRIRFRDPIV